MLTIDYQRFVAACEHCGRAYDAVRGSVFEAGAGTGLYLAGMHACSGEPAVVLAVAMLVGDKDADVLSLQVWSRDDVLQMSFLDGATSPWRQEAYLGRFLSAQVSRGHGRRGEVLEVAGLVCETIPEVRGFLDGRDTSS